MFQPLSPQRPLREDIQYCNVLQVRLHVKKAESLTKELADQPDACPSRLAKQPCLPSCPCGLSPPVLFPTLWDPRAPSTAPSFNFFNSLPFIADRSRDFQWGHDKRVLTPSAPFTLPTPPRPFRLPVKGLVHKLGICHCPLCKGPPFPWAPPLPSLGSAGVAPEGLRR